jgi:hypothetical protein
MKLAWDHLDSERSPRKRCKGCGPFSWRQIQAAFDGKIRQPSNLIGMPALVSV